MKIVILDEASIELDDAYEFYEYEQSGLGSKFVDSFTRTLELIKFYPKGWHPLSRKVKRCLIRGFPYGIIYQIKDNSIIILSVANLHRKPNYWIDRLK